MRNQRMFQDFLFLLNIDGFRFFQEKEKEEEERERGGPKGRPSQRENSIQ